MERNMAYEELLTALAAKLGIQGMIQEDGVCSVEIDGMTVSMVHFEDADALVLYGIIGDPPIEEEGRFNAMLLQSNNMFQGTGGATLSQNPESKEYAMQGQFPLAVIDADSLALALERFVDTLEHWKQVLEDFRPAGEEAAKFASNDAEMPPFFLGNGGFISV